VAVQVLDVISTFVSSKSRRAIAMSDLQKKIQNALSSSSLTSGLDELSIKALINTTGVLSSIQGATAVSLAFDPARIAYVSHSSCHMIHTLKLER
jgi:hypothetical protein